MWMPKERFASPAKHSSLLQKDTCRLLRVSHVRAEIAIVVQWAAETATVIAALADTATKGFGVQNFKTPARVSRVGVFYLPNSIFF